MQVSLFDSPKRKEPLYHTSLFNVLEFIKTNNTFKRIALKARLLNSQNTLKYKEFKTLVPAFTMSVCCKHRRKIQNNEIDDRLLSYNSIIQVDIDKINKNKIYEIKNTIAQDKHCLFCFISLSGCGVKAGFKIGPDVTQHTHYFNQVYYYIKDTYNIEIDKSTKDLYRLCFISYDPKLLINNNAIAINYNIKNKNINNDINNIYTTNVYKYTNINNNDKENIKIKKFNLISKMINNSCIGNRHNTRMRASMLLGGFVAGGLCSQNEAIDFLLKIIENNTNNIKLAKKDIFDGFNEGLKHPIYFS